MNKTETEGREIVDFLGGKFVGIDRIDGHDNPMFDLPASFPITLSATDDFGMKRTGYLAFHTSWDWLMTVVDKIESLTSEDGRGKVNYVVTIEPGSCIISRGGETVICEVQSDDDREKKIDIVYRCIMEFINYYNTAD